MNIHLVVNSKVLFVRGINYLDKISRLPMTDRVVLKNQLFCNEIFLDFPSNENSFGSFTKKTSIFSL